MLLGSKLTLKLVLAPAANWLVMPAELTMYSVHQVPPMSGVLIDSVPVPALVMNSVISAVGPAPMSWLPKSRGVPAGDCWWLICGPVAEPRFTRMIGCGTIAVPCTLISNGDVPENAALCGIWIVAVLVPAVVR